MGKIFDNNYVEVVLELFDGEECWYLLLFGVYYFKKLDQIWGVFDLFVKFKGVFLNDVLFFGFDLFNSLFGVFI